MKPKHLSLIFMALMLLSLSGVSYLETSKASTPARIPGLPPVPPLSDFKAPTAEQLQQMDRLERAIPSLTAPLPRRQQADLSAFGYVPMNPSSNGVGSSDAPSPSMEDHHVTLAFEGRYRRYCMIDGRLLCEGGVTEDGANVLKIESRRVLIQKKNIQKWLSVEPLFNALPTEKS